MIIKIAGAVLILVGCGCIGFLMTSSHKRTVKTLRQLIDSLEYMECEMQYRQLPLPEVLRRAASETGVIKEFFCVLAEELEGQIAPDVECCINATLGRVKELPNVVETCVKKLGKSIGHFDLDGQIKELHSVREECTALLTKNTNNMDTRLRNYQTLALCAGAVLVIFLF